MLPIVATDEFGVTLGTGEYVKGIGECKSVELELQGVKIVEDLLPLPLGNSDLGSKNWVLWRRI